MQIQAAPVIKAATSLSNSNVSADSENIAAPLAQGATLAGENQTAEEYAYVKKDVIKILSLLAVILLFLVGLYFVYKNTEILSGAGDWVYRALNIQTQ